MTRSIASGFHGEGDCTAAVLRKSRTNSHVTFRHPTPAISPESALILSSAGLAQDDPRWRGQLDAPLDWARVIRLARRESATRVLWNRLRALGCPGVPDEAQQNLRRLAMVSEFKLAHLGQHIHRTLAVLSEGRVDVMLLKGAAMANSVYTSPEERPMADIDLLVPRERAGEAHALAQHAGWVIGAKTSGRLTLYDTHQHLPPLDDAQGTGVGLDLHTDLFPAGHPFLLDAAEMRRRGRIVDLAGRPVAVPDAHDLLLHACIHFAWSHMFADGAWRTFRDVAAVLAATSLDEKLFVERARASRGATCCYWTLRLARDVGCVPVPPSLLGALRPRLPAAMLGALERHFALGMLPFDAIGPSVLLRRYAWRLGVLPGRSGHGDARPWTLTQQFSPGFGAPGGSPGIAQRAAAHWRRAAAWRSYAKAMLRGRGA